MSDRVNITAFAALCLAGCALLPFSAAAQDVATLNQENVKAFIEKTTHITQGHESEMTDEEIDAYLNLHIHEDANFKSTMRYNIPGYDVQEKTMRVDKQDFISGIDMASVSMSGYESIIEITGIEISKDKRKAIVRTKTLETGMMPVRDEIEQEEVPVEGVSSCTQIIMLSKKGVIQMFNAQCETDIQFETFEP